MRCHGLIGFACLAVLTGCATGNSLSRQMADWQTQDVSVALDNWGVPDTQEAIGDQVLMTWYDRAPQPFGLADETIAPAVICTRMLAVDAEGLITGWRWRGDRCAQVAPALRQAAIFPAHRKS